MNEVAWKYAIISLHNALQGYLCISLRNGNSFQTWNERHLKKWLKAYESKMELPKTKLDFFMELFDKAFSPEHNINRDNIEWLNDIRNELVHFNNDNFSIHKESAIRCCYEALAAIKLTPSIANGIFFYDEQQKEAFESSSRVATELLDMTAREA